MNWTQPRARRLAAVCLTMPLLIAACGGDTTDTGQTTVSDATSNTSAEDTTTTEADTQTSDEGTPTSEGTETGSSANTTSAGVEAAQWSDTVSISLGDGSFTFQSNGIPNHELPDQFLVPNLDTSPPFTGDDISAEFNIATTDELIVESPLDVTITLDPIYSEEITLTSLATIGVMISGAPLFNDYEDQGREFVALDDNLSLDGVFFIDSCNGHPLATGDSYHYHGVPYCITDDVDTPGQHSAVIGFLLDGFPIYGPQDADGVIITNADLDECSGHFGPTPEFPDGIYHYHLTEDAAPYSIDCFHGEIDYGGDAGGGPPGDGGPPDGAGPPAEG